MATVLGLLFWVIAAFVVLAVVPSALLLVGGLVSFLKTSGLKNGQEIADARRGFEVKSNTGETPVLLKERENDHG